MEKKSFSSLPDWIRSVLVLLCVAPSLALAENRTAPPPAPASPPAPPPASPPASPPAPPSAPDPAAASIKPQIEKLDEDRFRIGKVILDKKTREIRIPAKVNMEEGLLEFLLVQQQGKVHEALLITDASPTHLNLAFMLLRYPPSNELFSPLDETGHMTGILPDVPIAVQAGARILIEVEWKDGEAKTHRKPVNEWIQHSEKSTEMPPGPWLYTASSSHEGKYIPEITGDVVAIFTAGEAMINYPGNDAASDLVWHAFSKRVPAKDTEVTLIITPFFKKPAAAKP